MIYLQIFISMPLFVFVYQLYRYVVSRQGMHRQTACRMLGIFYFSAGAVILALRNPLSAMAGLLLLMLGMLLIAKGLDRIDKKIFIDHYEDDDEKKP